MQTMGKEDPRFKNSKPPSPERRIVISDFLVDRDRSIKTHQAARSKIKTSQNTRVHMASVESEFRNMDSQPSLGNMKRPAVGQIASMKVSTDFANNFEQQNRPNTTAQAGKAGKRTNVRVNAVRGADNINALVESGEGNIAEAIAEVNEQMKLNATPDVEQYSPN